MSLMILPCDSTKQPEKLDGFVDDPKKTPICLAKYIGSPPMFSQD
jgi:hypothetical protein